MQRAEMALSFRVLETARYTANYALLSCLLASALAVAAPRLDKFVLAHQFSDRFIFVLGTFLAHEILVQSFY
jgi:hypothetical protein